MQRLNPHPPVEHYEGLIFTHALRVVGLVDDDLDDIRQTYRIKAWKALEAFDPSKRRPKSGETVAQARDRFVFICLKNAEKDVLKRRRRAGTELSFHGADGNLRFESEARLEQDAVYFDVEDEAPLLPNTLSGVEVRVVVLLYRGYRQTEAARRLGIDSRHMKRVMKSIREKMADWRPGVGVVPMPVLDSNGVS